jgi:hypothetical protein
VLSEPVLITLTVNGGRYDARVWPTDPLIEVGEFITETETVQIIEVSAAVTPQMGESGNQVVFA